jgi:hypothetical protein
MTRSAVFAGVLSVVTIAAGAAGTASSGPAPAPAAPTFTRDVAPILYANCTTCHRTGEIAPMPLVSYQDARPWAKSIRAKVMAREMPPWGADPKHGKFKDDRSLSDAEIDTIVRWVDAGAPKGEDADLPRLPEFPAGWPKGQPDAIIAMPIEFAIPAEGEVDVIDFFTPTPFKEDVYVKGLAVKPSTPGVVHHAGVYVIEKLPTGARFEKGRIIGPDGKPMSRNQVARANGGTSTQEIQKLLSFVPGRGYEEYQGGAGQLIKAGSYIDFYMHYTPTGKPETDRTEIGLYFAKPGNAVTHQILHSFNAAGPTTYIVQGQEVLPKRSGKAEGDEGGVDLPPIPPYVDDWKVVSVHSIKEPITLYGLTPHLHFRGKSMKYTLTLPDGTEEILLSVPRYDFNWQVYYELETPRRIPAGSKVTVTTLFDNSIKNRYNPAPEKEVFWSEQSWDEMYAPQARITIDNREFKQQKTTLITEPIPRRQQ